MTTEEFNKAHDVFLEAMSDEEKRIADELSVSRECARHVIYLRTRSRWSEKLEKELIQLHKEGVSVNMNEFGVIRDDRSNATS